MALGGHRLAETEVVGPQAADQEATRGEYQPVLEDPGAARLAPPGADQEDRAEQEETHM